MIVYSTYRSDDGDLYLIPVEQFDKFHERLAELHAVIEKARQGDIVNPEEDDDWQVEWAEEELNSYIDEFDRLEGENYYIVLEKDYRP